MAMSLNNLAVLYVYMGQYAKAEPLYQRSLEIRESRTRAGSSRRGGELAELGGAVFQKWAEYAKAEPLYQEEPQRSRSRSSGRIIPTWRRA